MHRKLVSLLISLALLLAVAAPGAAQDGPTLRLGLLPILDALPFYVAQAQGYFEEAGLEVELVPVSSALERDQLVLAGQIDGMINDLISTGIFNQDEPRIQIIALGRRAYEGDPQYRILGAPRSNITIPQDLANVEIVISENSVIHYITQRILEAEGVDTTEIAYRAEPNIAIRYQLLLEGTFRAATLPDPLAQAAIENGAILIADDTPLVDSQVSQSVLSFRSEVIEEHPDAVEAFLEIWMRAAADINEDPEAYRDLWIENTNVPDDVRDSYVLPPFPIYELTTPDAWDDVMAWMLDEEIINEAPSYEDSVNDRFIAALAPTEDTVAVGDAAEGEALFASLGCVGCHAVEGDAPGAGPSLAGLAARAGSMVPGLSAAEYIHQSIVEPSAHVVEGYADFMPAYPTLSEEDIDALVAYLLTLD